MAKGGDQGMQARERACYRWACLFLAPGLLASCMVLIGAGMTVTAPPLLGFLLLVALLFWAHRAYSGQRDDPRLALMTGALAIMIASAVFAGIVANAGLRLRYPLFDQHLAAVDRFFGIDTPALVIWTAERPMLSGLLGWAYSSIFPLAFATAIWMGLRQRQQRVWELALGFAACIELAAIISVFTPALGNIVNAGLGKLAGHGLPVGAGVYHLHAVAAYRDGSGSVLDARQLEGVVTFPSFHMVMAIIVAYAFRGTGLIGRLIAAWCVLVAVSTVPIGGHYVVDLAGGGLLWLGAMALARISPPWWPAPERHWPTSAAPEAAA
jgi:membrane-associated phospholipid phosphatase